MGVCVLGVKGSRTAESRAPPRLLSTGVSWDQAAVQTRSVRLAQDSAASLTCSPVVLRLRPQE